MANEKAAPMNRADIVGAIAAKFEISQKQADDIAREYEAGILRAVSGGQEVRLNGFGSFKVQERAARTGRNPATGEEQEFPAKRVPKFTPSKAMKDALAASSPAPAKEEAAAEAPAAEAKPAKAPAKKAPAKKK